MYTAHINFFKSSEVSDIKICITEFASNCFQGICGSQVASHRQPADHCLRTGLGILTSLDIPGLPLGSPWSEPFSLPGLACPFQQHHDSF